MNAIRSIAFFDTQFERQVKERDFALNPFEKLALPYLQGRLLDMGCGLGNLSVEAARRGCSVLALDASPNAIARIQQAATEEALRRSTPWRPSDFSCSFPRGERWSFLRTPKRT
jgi:tellurite methyltransferase